MEFLRHSIENHVAVVTIQRAPANALSSGIIQELSALFDEMKESEDVRVVLIHGDGRFFSAGADIKEFTTIKSGEGFSNLSEDGQKIFEKIETYPKPVIAAIHGAALGGGLELAMSCHIRLVTEQANPGTRPS